MEGILDRLNTVKAERNIKSHEALAQVAGITRQSVRDWFTLKNEPSEASVKKICDKLNYNFEWLMHGMGDKSGKPYPENDKSLQFQEEGPTLMNIKSVLETYYKEIDLIKDLLTLKQEAYGKVIFPQGK